MFRIAALLCLGVVLAAPTQAASVDVVRPQQGGALRLAALRADDGRASTILDQARRSPLVAQVQELLARLGLYRGAVDGRLDAATTNAIRAYQRSSGLEVDGEISEDLLSKLEFSGQVWLLVRRLEDLRATQKAAARDALAAQPATRSLVAPGSEIEVADAARDPALCLAAPTVRCLLEEAENAARAVHRDRMRDWVLGELLTIQARAGMAAEALATAGKVDDPRLIIVGLRSIAVAQAESGRLAEALSTVEIIPDERAQAEALASLAAAQLRAGDGGGAARSVERIVVLVARTAISSAGVDLLADLAVTLAGAGDEALAGRALAAAAELSRAADSARDREAGLSAVATALARLDRPAAALGVLDELEAAAHRRPVLMAAAAASARAGDSAGALDLAVAIDEPRYRAVALSEIAIAQGRAGARAAEREIIGQAMQVTTGIKESSTYARAYAASRIAIAMVAVGAADEALAMAESIADQQLRARTLGSIAAAHARAGESAAARRAEARLMAAVEEIDSAFERTTVLSDIARADARVGDADGARTAFAGALAAARTLTNAWARARAYVTLAATLLELP